MNSKNNCESFMGSLSGNKNEGDYNENEINSKKDKGVKLSEGVDNSMALDSDTVEVILEQHGKQIEKCDSRLTELERTTTKVLISQGEISVKIGNIENGILKMENRSLEDANNLKCFQKELMENQKDLIERLIEKDTKISVSKDENKSKVRTQTIITLGAILTALISAYVAIYTITNQASKVGS